MNTDDVEDSAETMRSTMVDDDVYTFEGGKNKNDDDDDSEFDDHVDELGRTPLKTFTNLK